MFRHENSGTISTIGSYGTSDAFATGVSGRDNLRTKIIQEVHDSSLSIHLGRDRT
eukprot:SAG11_NODE_27494_length_332_cov_0.660944_1_plen_54_part_01